MITAIRWLYHRIGQMVCFATGAAILAASADGYELPGMIAGSILVLCGVLLKAIFHWRQMDDPNLV